MTSPAAARSSATRPLRPTRRRPSSRRTLLVVLALGAVVTAHAPSVITVQPGDTLWDLARKNNVSVSELQRLNGLDGSGVIYAGRTLTVSGSTAPPAAPAAPAAAATASHRVAAGDTLSHLAARYGVSAGSIAAANGLPSSGLIRIGATLTIPGASAPKAGLSPETTNAGRTIPDRVRASVAQNRTTLAGRRHPSKAQVRELVADTARRNGVDPSLAMAVAFHESGFQQRVVSPVNAIGVMQVLPSTGRGVAASIGRDLDLLDVQDNVTAGVVLLKQLVRATGSTDGALAGYYQGLGSVAERGRLPQTDAYIKNVTALRSRFGG